MHLFLNPASGQVVEGSRHHSSGNSGNSLPGRGIPLAVGDGGNNSFSRMLAGKLDGLDEGNRKISAGSDQENSRRSSFDENPTGGRFEPQVSQAGSSAGAGDSAGLGNSAPADDAALWVTDSDSLSPTAVSWAGWSGFLQVGHPSAQGHVAAWGQVQPGGFPTEIMARLGAEIGTHYSERDGIQTFSMVLKPDTLGQVDVRLQAQADQLSVRLQAVNPESESALRENIKELTEAIQTRTGRFQHIEVRVELKENAESSRDPDQEKSRDSREEDSQRNDSQDPNPQGNMENRNAEGADNEPDPRAQEG